MTGTTSMTATMATRVTMARIVTKPTMTIMARLAYLAGALVPVWDCDILDLERGARGYFRCCAIVSCRYYLSSGCAHPPLSCNSVTLKGNAHDLFVPQFVLIWRCSIKAQRYGLSGASLKWFIRVRMSFAAGRTSSHPLPAGGGVACAEIPIAGFLPVSIAASACAPLARGLLGLGLLFASAVRVAICLIQESMIPALFRRGYSGVSVSLRARQALLEDFSPSASSIAAPLVRAPDLGPLASSSCICTESLFELEGLCRLQCPVAPKRQDPIEGRVADCETPFPRAR